MLTKSINLNKKFYFLFLLIIALFVLFAVSSIFTVREINTLQNETADYRQVQAKVKIGKNLQLRIANIWQFITDASLTKDKTVIEEEAKPNLDKIRKDI